MNHPTRHKLARILRIPAGAPLYQGQIIALPQDRMLYYAIPKVACSSIMSALVDALDIAFPADEWKPEVFQTRKWDHLFDRRSVVPARRARLRHRGFWSFAFVRNPWDRLVSCYSEKIRSDGDPENFVGGVSKVLLPYGVFRGGMPFDEFAWAVAAIPDRDAEPHFRSQHEFITDRSGRILVDFIGKFERLSNDFDSVRARIGRPVQLPHLLKSSHRGYRNYYDSRLRDIIGARYAQDIARFGYEF